MFFDFLGFFEFFFHKTRLVSVNELKMAIVILLYNPFVSETRSVIKQQPIKLTNNDTQQL